MYNAFRKMIEDLYNIDDMVEFCYVNGIKYKCFVSSMEGGSLYTQAGLEDLVNFILQLQLSEQSKNNIPKENDKVIFRNKEYKISHTEYDSALSTIKLYMVSVSRGK